MTISTKEVIILPKLLYYFQGNFYHSLYPKGKEIGQIKRAIREFHKSHAELLKSDRASPDFLDLTQLANL